MSNRHVTPGGCYKHEHVTPGGCYKHELLQGLSRRPYALCATYWGEVGTYSDISSIGLQQVNGRGTKMRREDFLLHRAPIPTSSKLIKKRWRSVMVSFGAAKVLIMNYFLLLVGKASHLCAIQFLQIA